MEFKYFIYKLGCYKINPSTKLHEEKPIFV